MKQQNDIKMVMEAKGFKEALGNQTVLLTAEGKKALGLENYKKVN